MIGGGGRAFVKVGHTFLIEIKVWGRGRGGGGNYLSIFEGFFIITFTNFLSYVTDISWGKDGIFSDKILVC